MTVWEMMAMFKGKWESIEKDETRPRRLRNIVKIRFEDLYEKMFSYQSVCELIEMLYAGDLLIVQRAFSREFIVKLKEEIFRWGKDTEDSFHKIYDDVPNFHRIIDESLRDKYAHESIRHAYYLFPWNEDKFNIMTNVYEKWRILKVLAGLDSHEYEKNKPNDGIVDRINIAHYPLGCGEMETHSDPYLYQRTIMATKMSERGKDYSSGGLYFINKDDKKVDIEQETYLGDMYVSYSTVLHGVDVIDKHRPTDWNDPSGRWFMGLYSTVSDTVKERHTSYGVKLDVATP